MKVKVSRMSKVTAVLVAMIMVATLAFSVLAYFGNNMGGNDTPLIGSGVAGAGDTAGASFDMASATPVTNAMLKDNGAIKNADGTVTWTGPRGGAGRTATDNGTSSKFPTTYFQLPSYGAYDFSEQLAGANDASMNGRLFGIEQKGTYEKANSATKWNSNESMNTGFKYVNKGAGEERAKEIRGKGLYIKAEEKVTSKNGDFLVYTNIALPDNAVSDGSVSMDIDFNISSKIQGAGTCGLRGSMGYAIIAETGSAGMSTPFFSSSTKNSIGLNHNKHWVETPAWKNGGDGVAYDSSEYKVLTPGNDSTKARNIDSFKNNSFSYGVKNTYTIPAGTKYLRVIFAFTNFENNGFGEASIGGQKHTAEFALTNLKIKLTDNNNGTDGYNHFDLSKSGQKNLTNSYGGKYEIPANNENTNDVNLAPTDWAQIRYFDAHYAVKNGAMTRAQAFDKKNGIGFRYYDPVAKAVKKITLGNMKILGRDEITPNDYLYIVEDKLKDTTAGHSDKDAVKFAHLDGTTDYHSGGINIRVACRTGIFYIDNQVTMYPSSNAGKETNFLVWDEQFGAPTGEAPNKMTQIKVDCTSAPAVKTTIINSNKHENEAFDIKFNNLDVKSEDLPTQTSLEKLYYYLSDDVFNGDLSGLVGHGATEISSHTATDAQIAGFTHAKKYLTIFICDAAGNATRLTAPTDYIIADGSTIDETTSIVDINKMDDTTWTKGNITFTIKAQPTETSKDFLAGVRAYVKRTDKTRVPATPTYEVVSLDVNEAQGKSGTYTISTNVYEDIEIILVNIVDDDRVNYQTLPAQDKQTQIKFNKQSGENNVYTARRDASVPEFNNVLVVNNESNGTWTSGYNTWQVGLNGFNDMKMFKDESAKLKFEIKFEGGAYEELTVDASDATTAFKDGSSIIKMYLGTPYGSNSSKDKNAVEMKTASAPFKDSYAGKVSFRVAFPNDDATYYYFDNSSTTTVTNETQYTSYKVQLDNTMPDVELTANYIEADVKTLVGASTYDNADYTKAIKDIAAATPSNSVTINGTQYVVKSVPRDGSWFWGTVAIKVNVKNYDNILSKADMSPVTMCRDLFKTDSNIRIYDQVANEKSAPASISYLTFCQGIKNTSGQTEPPAPIVESFERGLGFRIANGAGVVSEAKLTAEGTTNQVANNNNLAITMRYDNIAPDFEIKIGGAVKESGRHWYGDKDIDNVATITDKTTATNADQLVTPTFLAEYWYGESTAGDPTAQLNLPMPGQVGAVAPIMYDGTVGTLTASTDGAYTYRITASNRAGRKMVKEVLVGLDRVADTITINDWLATGHVGDVKYVRANEFTMNVTPSAKVSNVTYYFITSDRANIILTDSEIVAQKAENKKANLVDTTLTVSGISDMGDKYMYILAEDEAHNQSILGMDGTYKLTVDTNKDYTLTLGTLNGDLSRGGYTYTIYDKNDGTAVGAENQAYDSTINNLQVGYYVKVTAAANAGIKFLGFYDDVQVDDPNNNIIDINIDYKSASRAYTKNGAFKTIISDLAINNNNQRGTSYKAIDGTFKNGVEADQSVATAVSAGNLVITWLGDDPSQPDYTITEFPATFDYTITVKNANDYWMEKAYAGTLIISDKAVLNIIFNSANASKTYEYNGAPFLTYASGAKVMGGDFATNFATYATAMDEKNVDKASEFATMLNSTGLPDGAVITLENIDSTATGVESATNVGKYRWTITYDYQTAKGQPQPETITNVNEYNIKFSYEFTVTPREIALEQKAPTIEKEYDNGLDVLVGGTKVDNANIAWDTYLVATKTSGDALVGGDTLGDIISLTSFGYADKNVSNKAIASMVIAKKDTPKAKNYTISTATSMTFAATITTRGIDIVYNTAGGQTFVKAYDGNNSISTEQIDALKTINAPNSYWVANTLDPSEQLSFVFAKGAIHLAHPNVGGNSIVVDSSKASLESVGSIATVNYHIKSIAPIENTPLNPNIVKITRKTVTISESSGAIKDGKYFDGTNITIALDHNGLIPSDVTLGIYGVPAIFDSTLEIIYREDKLGTPTMKWGVGDTNSKKWDGKEWVDSGEPFTWDAGFYTINIGVEGDGDDAGKIVAGNYILESSLSKDGFSYSVDGYEIKKQELHIVFDGVDKNTKAYDAIGIGVDSAGVPVDQVLSSNELETKKTMSFGIVNQNGEPVLTLPEGYSIAFQAYNSNSNAGTYRLTTTTPVIYYNSVQNDRNYLVVIDNVDNIAYEITKRTLKVSPKKDTMSFVAGANRMTQNIAKYADMNVTVLGANGEYAAAEGELLSQLEMENFDLLFTMKNGVENAIQANKALSVSAFAVPQVYSWAVEGTATNYDFLVDDEAVAYIEQARYYITDLLYNSEEPFNDSSTFQLPVFGLGHGYHVKTEDGEQVSLTGLSDVDYYKFTGGAQKDGTPYVGAGSFLRYSSAGAVEDHMDLFGIGKYEIRFVKSAVADVNDNGMTDYIIANVGENNEIYKTTIVNKKIVVMNDSTAQPVHYTLTVKPIGITITAKALDNKPYGEYTVGDILRSYSYVTSNDNKGIADTAKRAEVGERDVNGISVAGTSVKIKNYTGKYEEADLAKKIDAGIYGLDFSAIQKALGANYQVTATSRDVTVSGIEVFIKFTENELVKVYDKEVVADIEKTEFFDKWGADVTSAVNTATGKTNKITFRVGGGAEVNAGVYGLTIVEGEGTVIPTGNYTLSPTIFMAGTPTKYTIKERPVNITMKRDGAADLKATYGKDGFNTMKGAFTYDIEKDGADRGVLSTADSEILAGIVAKMKAATYLFEIVPQSNNDISVFNINFGNIADIETIATANYRLSIEGINGFELTKRVIKPTVGWAEGNSAPGVDATYGDTGVNVGADAYKITFAFNDTPNEDLTAAIGTYLVFPGGAPSVDIVESASATEGTLTFRVNMKKNYQFVNGKAAGDDITIGQAYVVKDARDLNTVPDADVNDIKFDLKKLAVDLDLTLDKAYSEGESVDVTSGGGKVKGYIYGDKTTGTAFDPLAKKHTPYVLSMTNKLEGDTLALDGNYVITYKPYEITPADPAMGTKAVYSKDLIVVTVKFAYTLANEKFYAVNDAALTKVANTKYYTKDFIVKKPDVEIKIAKKGGVTDLGNYDKNFFDKFEGTINGVADFDEWAKITILPEHMKFYDMDDFKATNKDDTPRFDKSIYPIESTLQTLASDNTKATSVIILDESKIDKDLYKRLAEFYVVKVAPSEKFEFGKATITFTNPDYRMVYDKDSVKDTIVKNEAGVPTGEIIEPKYTASFDASASSVMRVGDEKYAYASFVRRNPSTGLDETVYYSPSDGGSDLLVFKNNGLTDAEKIYYINTLNVKTDPDGNVIAHEVAETRKAFAPNPKYFNTKSPLYLYDMNFGIVVEKCPITVQLQYNKVNGASIPHTFDYGTTRAEIVEHIKSLNVRILPSGSNVALDNTGYGIIELDTTSVTASADLLNVGDYSTMEIGFTVKSSNYILAGGAPKAEKVNIKINPKRLFFKATKDGNVLFTSVFGNVYNRDLQDALLAKPQGITIEWYEKSVTADGKVTYKKCAGNGVDGAVGSLTYGDNDAKLKYSATTQNYYAGKHEIAISLPNETNYVVSPVPVLDALGAPTMRGTAEVLEKCYVEYTPLHITIGGMNALDKDASERCYGTTYGTLKSAYDKSQVYNNIAFKLDGVNGVEWVAVDNLVRDVVRNSLQFKMTFADGREFPTVGATAIGDNSMLDAGTYKGVFYMNYPKNVIESIVIDNDTATPSIIDINIKKYDISTKVNALVDGVRVDANTISRDYDAKFHDGRIKFRLDFNGTILDDMNKIVCTIPGEMKNADTYEIVVNVSDKEVRDPFTGAIVKENASNNFEGTYTFTYTINKLDLASVITNTDRVLSFDNKFHDDDLAIAIRDNILRADQLAVTINGKPFMDKNDNADMYGNRNKGIIKNVGTYAIGVTISDVVALANFNNADYVFNVVINPHKVVLAVNDGTEYRQTYGNDIRIALADKGIAEYRDSDTTNDIFLVDPITKEYTIDAVANFTRKYVSVTDSTKTYTDATIATAPVGKYKVTFAMTAGSNYEAVGGEYVYTFEIVARDIAIYLDTYTRNALDKNDTRLNTAGVQLVSGATLDKKDGKYKVDYVDGGITITFNSVADIFKGIALDEADNTDYTANIIGVKLDLFLNGKMLEDKSVVLDLKDVASKATKPAITIDNAGAYVVSVSYITDGNVTLGNSVKKYAVNVSMLSADTDTTISKSIIVKDVLPMDKVDKNDPDVYPFEYDGATPTIVLSIKKGDVVEDISYNTSSIVYYVANATNGWDKLDAGVTPKNVGKYKAVFALTDQNIAGTKEILFNIMPTKVDITFAEDNITKVGYKESYDIKYTTDEKYVDVSYYQNGTKLASKPVNAGTYAMRASIKPEYLAPEGAEPNVVFNQEVVEHVFTINKIKYTGTAKVTKYNASKVYDGKMVTVKVDNSLFSGLPEGASIKLKSQIIKDAGVYKLRADVSSPNYTTFTMDYGTYEVKKAKVEPKLDPETPKTTTSITLEPIKLDGVIVEYSIDGGENYQTENVFEDLEPNKEYEITIMLKDKKTKKPAKNYDFETAVLKVATEHEDKISTMQIVGMAAGGGVAVLSIVVFAVVMGIRRKRRV